MDPLKRYQQLKKLADDKQKGIDQDTGAFLQIKAQLKKELGIETLKEGEALRAKIIADGKEMSKKLEEETRKFEGELKNEFGEIPEED